MNLTERPAGAATTPIAEVKHVIAVMSGKGGVGKSLVSGLLAMGLRRRGYAVGILDADITGPSIPKMFFPNGAFPQAAIEGLLPPVTAGGLKIMSINLLLTNEDQAVIWRGPLISSAIRQFWDEVVWGKLDYMVVDLPPGTSDASLTTLQSLPMSGVVLVTSPQDLAGMVVRKAAHMVKQLEAPILGLVENMSYFECPDNGRRYEIFGPSHAEETAAKLGTHLLGCLPILPELAALSDSGAIESYTGDIFTPIADELIRVAPPARPALMPK
jgi:Mrp family chromosome partitioning ATPase